MKIFTSIVLAGALVVAALPANAGKFTGKKFAKKASVEKVTTPADGIMSRVRAAEEAAKKEYKPTKEKFYEYYDGDWALSADSELAYDEKGNLVTFVQHTVDDEFIKSEYTYDAYGNKLKEVVSVSLDGTGWTPYEMTEYTYDDPILHNMKTGEDKYRYDNGTPDKYYGVKFVVERDADNNITLYEVQSYFQGKYDPIIRTEVTYAGGKAVSWVMSRLEPVGDDEYAFAANMTLENIEWQDFDGQIATDDINDFLIGANRIKKALVIDNEDGMEAMLDVTYSGAADFVAVFKAEMDGESYTETHSYTVTDDFGSYEEKFATVYTGGEGSYSEGESVVVKYDEHGNFLSETASANEDGEEYVYMQNVCDYVYGENGEMLQVINSEYDFDLEQLVPFAKIESSDFIGFDTTGVAGVTSGAMKCVYTGGSLAVSGVSTVSVNVYSATGMLVASESGTGAFAVDVTMLPAGVYVAVVGDGGSSVAVKFAK